MNIGTSGVSINNLTLNSTNIGLGQNAALSNQGTHSIGIGLNSGSLSQGINSVAIGLQTG
jgi:hypothetical protein